jgi:DNA-binding NarL/FixJ family response regulator
MNPSCPVFIIADTHDVYRIGVLNLLKQHFTGCTVTEVTDTGNLLQTVQQQQYDIILIDTGLPPGNGFNAARSVIQLHADCRIIMYANTGGEEVVAEAFASGANAFFYNDEPQQQIIFKVTEMLKNGCCITANTIKAYRTAQQRIIKNNGHPKPLTLREKEVLQYIIKGLKNREIAEVLYLSVKTIINHRCNIMRKANCHNTAQLLAYAKKMGWI